MKKGILIGIFAILMAGIIVHAEEDDYDKLKTQQDKANWLNDRLGIEVTGSNFIYDKATNALTVTAGSTAKIPVYFPGNVKVIGAEVKIGEDLTFSGVGSYSKFSGFNIQNGVFNDVPISNGNSVTYNKNTNEVRGVAGKDCNVGGGSIGEGTEFRINKKDNTITYNGVSGSTTLPNADIKRCGFYYCTGNMKVDTINSKIYLAPGDKMIFDGIPITAENRVVQLVFKEDDAGYSIIPVKTFVVSKSDLSISDVFKEAGYGSNNRDARKEWYERTYEEEYKATGNQNTRMLNDLRDGKVDLTYNEGASNVQIRFPSQKLGHAPFPQPTSKNDESYGKFAERFLSKEFNGLNDNLDKTKIPETSETVREAAIRLTNEHNANPKARANVDAADILSKIAVESSANIKAQRTGANQEISRGLLQLTPIAIKELNSLGGKYDFNEVSNNPAMNLKAGIEYYALMLERCGGSKACALAAYNLGEGKTIGPFKKTGNVPAGVKYHVGKVLGFRDRLTKEYY